MGKPAEHHHAREIWAVVLVGLALLLLLSLISYHPFDVGNAASSHGQPVRNFIGPVGAWIGYLTFSTWGLGGFALMVVLAVVGGMLLTRREIEWPSKIGAGLLLLVASSVLLHIGRLESVRQSLNLASAGGFVGLFVGDFFVRLVGTVGTVIVFFAFYLISLILLINFTPSYWVAVGYENLKDWWAKRQGADRPSVADALKEQQRELRQKEMAVDREVSRKEKEAQQLEKEREKQKDQKERGKEVEPEKAKDKDKEVVPPRTPRPEPVIVDRSMPVTQLEAQEKKHKPEEKKTTEKVVDDWAPGRKEPATPVPAAAAVAASAAPAPVVAAAAPVATPAPAVPAPAKPKFEKPAPAPSTVLSSDSAGSGDGYVMPPADLLAQPPAMSERSIMVDDLKASAKILRETLNDFGIEVESGDITRGPAITLYELYPAPGVKVEKISALSNNIALAMKAEKVRILTPVPGKGTVGIEVPNSSTTMVYLRDFLDSQEWRTTKARIPLALGRDVKGNPIIADLAEMPHLLIAGATGSGKTVCVNAILAAMLYRFTPQQLRLILIDPKMVEMANYNSLPHLVVPVVTESKKVPLALRWVINEMEKRYQIFAKVGVRNITAFNNRPRPAPAPAGAAAGPQATQEELKIVVPRDDDLVIPDKLPYVVVVIDELADLMHTVPVEVEGAIARLTALARAAGIHVIIATQRPSVDVVTGVIKSNIPARIAFQVASKQDSRVILDANGADKLLGKGDMLYLPPGSAKLIRAQGVLVSDEEVHRLVEFISARAKPKFEQEIHQKLQKNSAGLTSDEPDEEDEALVEQCIEVIRQTNRASVSVLQRRLRIGYTRAARIMDLLEERGVVGPNKGAEPRDILVDLHTEVPAEQEP